MGGSGPRPSLGLAAAAAPQAATRRILIVDDERDAADSLELLLEVRGHEVRAATDGRAALEAVQTFEAEIALVDLGLPGIDGYDLAPLLRERLPNAVLVATTGYQKDSARLEAAGFQHYLLKPVDLQRLTEILAIPSRRGGD